jgi:shikimate dehydrogenase
MEYGIIGRTLKHSFSVEVHRSFGYGYELKELEPEELEEFFRKREFKGINVTIPYKTEVMKYLDEIDEWAEEIGAVNTVVNQKGKLKGYNTDIFGMKKMIEKMGVTLEDKRVLILGTGGTSKTAEFVAKKMKAKEITDHINKVKEKKYMKHMLNI